MVYVAGISDFSASVVIYAMKILLFHGFNSFLPFPVLLKYKVMQRNNISRVSRNFSFLICFRYSDKIYCSYMFYEQYVFSFQFL